MLSLLLNKIYQLLSILRQFTKYFSMAKEAKKEDDKTKPKNANHITLKRGKLPSNWNKFVETASTSKKAIQKFPKSLDTVANATKLGKTGTQSTTNRAIAIDCEMVGINDHGRDHMLARVSLVDENGKVVYDTFVKPTQRVIDYRTDVSGVRATDIENGRDFKTVQTDVHALIQNKILVGHALKNDLKVLFLHHNKKYIRDTSKFKRFREENKGRTPSLRFLSAKYLGIAIQSGEHSSVEDAQATMLLYKKFKSIWEAELRKKRFNH